MCPKLLGNGMRYTGFSWMRMCTLGCVCVRSRFFLCEEGSLVGVFYLKLLFFFFFFEVNSSLSARCGLGRGCFVVVEKWVR